MAGVIPSSCTVDREVALVFPAGCKLMIVAIVRLLSLANQLASDGKRVRLVFLEGASGTMGYVDRMGFFDRLSDAVEVAPARPGIQAHSRIWARMSAWSKLPRLSAASAASALAIRSATSAFNCASTLPACS